jgi:nucleoside-diphosphate-sugar epimerase
MTLSKVLVTGASGFVGRALVADLLRRGAEVTAATRRDVALPQRAIVARVGDLTSVTNWSDALRGCDTVVHCAARVHVLNDSAVNPMEAFRIANVLGTVRLAQQAADTGVRRFVFVSSVKVNGERTTPGNPFTERDMPTPRDPYGISKFEAEGALERIAASGGFELVIVRPPLVYGPGVKANFLAMTKWLQRGVPLPFGGLTANRRTLIALDNLLDLIATVLVHPAAANQIFLGGDGEDLSTAELLRRTAAALGTKARLLPVPAELLEKSAGLLHRHDLWQRLGGSLQCSIAHARTRLGWNPPVSVDEGLRRAVQRVSAP